MGPSVTHTIPRSDDLCVVRPLAQYFAVSADDLCSADFTLADVEHGNFGMKFYPNGRLARLGEDVTCAQGW